LDLFNDLLGDKVIVSKFSQHGFIYAVKKNDPTKGPWNARKAVQGLLKDPHNATISDRQAHKAKVEGAREREK